MADVQVPVHTPNELPQNSYLPIAGAALVAGTPVYQSTTESEVLPAQGTALPQAKVLGFTTTSAPLGDRVNVQTMGPLTLTAAEWAAVVVGGALVTGTQYFSSPGTAGKICPANDIGEGDLYTPVGVALSTLTLDILITAPRTNGLG